MRLKFSGHRAAALKRGTALALLGTLAAGCSADVSRFTDTTMFTGSTANQRQIIGEPGYQPYPGDIKANPVNNNFPDSPSREAVRPLDLTGNGVARSELAPVTTDVAPVEQQTSLLAPTRSATPDPVETGTVNKRESNDAPAEGGGWGGTGGTQVTLREGETIYNLSRRFGVPVNAILQANNITDATSVRAGSRIIIPTYVYSHKAPVSAPDNNPKVAKASAGRGDSVPDDRNPEENDRQAILPNAPSSRGKDEAGTISANQNKSDTDNTNVAPLGQYTVVSGDTLFEIARNNGTTTALLKEANGLSDGFIRVGQVLKIPGNAASEQRKNTEEKLDQQVTGATTLERQRETGKVAQNEPIVAVVSKESKPLPQYTPPDQTTDELIQEARVEAPDSTGVGKMRWPAKGRVINEFGKSAGSRKSDGIDIALPTGTPIKAAENGVVIYAGNGLKEFGNTVLLRHEDGLVTVYGHASILKVARGDKVKRGDEIARSGMSGEADMPKLHFEVREKSVPVDPMRFLQ